VTGETIEEYAARVRARGRCLCGAESTDKETQTCGPCRADRHLGSLEDNRQERRRGE
jgi:hypothetical protein